MADDWEHRPLPEYKLGIRMRDLVAGSSPGPSSSQPFSNQHTLLTPIADGFLQVVNG
jgi:hypothetical protein